jgi:hypothetical protein
MQIGQQRSGMAIPGLGVLIEICSTEAGTDATTTTTDTSMEDDGDSSIDSDQTTSLSVLLFLHSMKKSTIGMKRRASPPTLQTIGQTRYTAKARSGERTFDRLSYPISASTFSPTSTMFISYEMTL